MKTKQEIALELLLMKASQKFVQKQYVAQAEFYEPWLEIGFTAEEVGDALGDAVDELYRQFDEITEERNGHCSRENELRMVTLYKHQRDALVHLRQNNYFALFMEQGTGKTLPILYHIAKLFEDGEIESALVVAPLSTLGAWTRDIDLLHPKQQTALKSLVTVNYDKVWRRDEFIKGKWDLIVLDESHAIKHRTSKRSKALRKMANSATYRYILTGTPMSNGHLHEYWAQYDFLNPEVFGRYGQFQDRYCLLNQFNQPYKYKRVDELTEIINRHCYRITKEECLDLPDKLPDDVIKIELKEKKKYKQMMDNIIKE